MDKCTVKKLIMGATVFCLLVVLTPGAALSWDAAAHAYIEEHLYRKQGQTDSGVLHNRIYGSGATDLFNRTFTSPYVEYAAYLHETTADNVLKAWQMAASREEKAFAYGFVGHNNAWGMDATAHVSGITSGRGKGYVIAKAQVLAVMLKPVLADAGLNLPDAVVVDVCHYLVESGVDLLVRALDPAIGNKLMAAAYLRSDQVPALLINAYAMDFAALAGGQQNAAQIIATAEGMFRAYTMGYGWALTQDNALDLVADGLSKIGTSYLGLPPEYSQILFPLVKQGILASMTLCAPDFERELRASTGWVNGNLSEERIIW
jgi:hypothetical protein